MIKIAQLEDIKKTYFMQDLKSMPQDLG